MTQTSTIPLLLPRPHITTQLILLLSLGLGAPLQLTAQQPVPHPIILLDPAHGGPDAGAHLSTSLLEKDLTLAFAARLRTFLTTKGFTVISTRDSDPAALFPPDQRAEIANHAHPTACLILHATPSGAGIHLVTSALPPPGNETQSEPQTQTEPGDSDTRHAAIPWSTAQAASIPQSLRLANQLGVALLHAKLPVTLYRSSLRPLDNLTCPAVVIEIAPSVADHSPVDNTSYQQQIAQAIAQGLTAWAAGETSGAAR